MKMHFNIVLDTREDGTKVFSAKCLKCDAVLVGERGHPVTMFEVAGNVPQSQFESMRQQLRKLWELARTTGQPILVAEGLIEHKPIPDHGLERCLEAHIEACSKR